MSRCRALLGVGLLLWAGIAPAGDDAGLAEMDATVREACVCAAPRRDGVDAAIQCSASTRRYATQAVGYRDRWDDAQRKVEATLRQVLEHCLTQAKPYVQSLDELGLLESGLGGGIQRPAPLATWYRAPVQTLHRYTGDLARVSTVFGVTDKGMIVTVEDDELVLRLAGMDGGGERRLPLGSITQVRVLRFPRP